MEHRSSLILERSISTTIFTQPDSLFPTDLFAFGKSGREKIRLNDYTYKLFSVCACVPSTRFHFINVICSLLFVIVHGIVEISQPNPNQYHITRCSRLLNFHDLTVTGHQAMPSSVASSSFSLRLGTRANANEVS